MYVVGGEKPITPSWRPATAYNKIRRLCAAEDGPEQAPCEALWRFQMVGDIVDCTNY
jgi:hypothetical protein